VGDYLSIETGGWFQSDAAVPEFPEVFTDGWFNTYDSSWTPAVADSSVIDTAMYVMQSRR